MDSFLTSLAACADPLRWRILKLLQHYPETCVCDLQSVLDVPQSTLSSHLAVLRRALLVSSQKRGTWAYYCLSAGVAPWLTKLELGPMPAEPSLLSQLKTDILRATQTPGCCPIQSGQDAFSKPSSRVTSSTSPLGS